MSKFTCSFVDGYVGHYSPCFKTECAKRSFFKTIVSCSLKQCNMIDWDEVFGGNLQPNPQPAMFRVEDMKLQEYVLCSTYAMYVCKVRMKCIHVCVYDV
jgi:hypothetical protein